MKFIARSVIITAWATSALSFGEPEDWRLQILSDAGLSLKKAEEKFIDRDASLNEQKFRELVQSLGSEDFATRVEAQRQIEDLGTAAVPLIRELPEIDDPETSLRLKQIENKLASHRCWTEKELLRYATTTLAGEARGEKKPEKTPLVFAAIFQDEVDPLVKEYRHFDFVRDEGLTAKITGGEFLMPGAHEHGGDQRFILRCEEISGKETFPNEFLLEVSAKATPGGAGSFHIGVSVGNVRVLFHPGYRGGGFRHERVDDKKELTRNRDMGFTPQAGEISTISLAVKKLRNGMIELKTKIHQEGSKKPFESKIQLPLKEFGELTIVSLDRSGRPGGTAIFDDFVIEMDPKD